MSDTEQSRILLFTGKGGVGKTTIAAATAVRSAAFGHKTLVTSTDAAHSLGDALALDLGDEVTEVAPGLFARETDARAQLKEHWGELQSWLAELVGKAGVGQVVADELAVIPGLEEVFALGDLVETVQRGTYDVVVVDCAPTAETIRLLSLPDVISFWFDRLAPAGANSIAAWSPIVEQLLQMPLPETRVLESARGVVGSLADARRILTDTSVTTARLVVTPEHLVVSEALRTYSYLSLFGYGVDAVVVNRVLPSELEDGFFHDWRQIQAEHIRTIRRDFDPIPTMEVPMAPAEIVGLDRLESVGRQLYGDQDPAAVAQLPPTMELVEVDGRPCLRLALGTVERDDVSLGRRGGELLVRIGSWQRVLNLPESLALRQIEGAEISEGALTIRFGSG